MAKRLTFILAFTNRPYKVIYSQGIFKQSIKIVISSEPIGVICYMINTVFPPSAQLHAHGERLFYLDISRVIAIISITLYHAFTRCGFHLGSKHLAEAAIHSGHYLFLKAILYVFCRVGVPLFLMISGALLMRKKMNSKADLHFFYKHNVLNLVVTAEIWYVIMYWFELVFRPSNNVLETSSAWQMIWGMIKNSFFVDQVTMGSMWYMAMILPFYLTVPVLIMVKDKISSKWLLLPILLSYWVRMLLPTMNSALAIINISQFSNAIASKYVLPMYYVYFVIGYYIDNGQLNKWKDWHVFGVFIISFGCGVLYQYYGFAYTDSVYIQYEFALLPICAGAILELTRRKSDWLCAFKGIITYLSRVSFGVYFVHIVIMSYLVWNDLFLGYHPYAKLFILEAISFLGSIIIIASLSKVPFIKQWVFMIK